MKKLLKIQSISDIITNSSSEVFLMDSRDAERFKNIVPDNCLDITYISWEYLRNNVDELILRELSDVNIRLTTKEDWNKALIDYKDSFEKIIGYCLVDIEDNFPDWEEVYDEARDCCLVYESTH